MEFLKVKGVVCQNQGTFLKGNGSKELLMVRGSSGFFVKSVKEITMKVK